MKRFREMWSAFLQSPVKVIILFVILMLVPNAVLVVTEPYTLTTILALLLLPAGFYLLWAVVVRQAGIMILCAFPFMILAAFQLVISYLFGSSIIAIDMFTNVFTTSSSEIGELLGTIYPSIILVCVLYIPLVVIGIYYVVRKIKTPVIRRKRFAVIGLVLCVLGLVSAKISDHRNPAFGIKYHVFPVNVCYNITVAVERWNHSLAYPETSKEFRYDARKEWDSTRREVYVLVIGEASRAYSWGLYGYQRETNPELSRVENLVLFRDMLTESNTTHKSVPIMLSPISAENFDSLRFVKGMPVLFSEAGFRTVFISNQPANRTFTEFFARQADTLIEVTTEEDIATTGHRYDGEVIPYIRELLNETTDNLLIIVHTYGSHASYIKRYPRSAAYFEPDAMVSVSKKSRGNILNAYDNTIQYTDRVLSEIIGVLDSTDVCSALLYCADHGEDVMDDPRGRYLHASPTTTYYQLHVASFAWFSEAYIGQFPDKYRAARDNRSKAASSSSIFHTLGDIASIRSPYLKSERSLVSPYWQDRMQLYVNDYDEAIPFLDMGLTGYDLEMMDRLDIRYDKDQLRKIRY